MRLDQPALIEPPSNPADRAEWRRELAAWRNEARKSLNYDGAAYRLPEFQWASKCFSCNMLMVWDEKFLDARTGRYKVEEYLEEGQRVFGGYDGIVLWQAYPRIGVDSRNQFDFYRDLPGGLEGLKDVARRFRAKGCRVFIDYNPWDTGTRREGVDDAEAIGQVIHDATIDGVFLDTLDRGGIEMRHAADRARPGVVFESEGALPLESLPLNHLSWGQWFDYRLPGVLRNRWIEQRHTIHMVRRWDLDHTDEMHIAWLNGTGMLVWENVFGSWVGWSPQNRSMIRMMVPLLRRFNEHFSEGQWTPMVETTDPSLFGSEWTRGDVTVWTIVNRSSTAMKGIPIEHRKKPGEMFLGVVPGHIVDPKEMEIEPKGIALLVSMPDDERATALKKYLTTTVEPMRNGEHASRLLHPMPLREARSEPHSPHPDFVSVPAGDHEITTHFRVRECGERGYSRLSDTAYPGLHQDLAEKRNFRLSEFQLAKREVTNAEYFEFLEATGYKPHVHDNFLKHWQDAKPKPGTEEEPVVYVDLEDARAYAKWKHMRLPTDAEWQVGMEMHNLSRGPKPVWNWTDNEYGDGRTRYSLIRGGSWYEAHGSGWYADGGVKSPQFAAKFIHIWPGVDRCETIGFRVAR